MFSEPFAKQVVADASLQPGSLVLDPWLGAGTTAVAALQGNLRAVGLDINPAMVAISRGRVCPRIAAGRALANVITAVNDLTHDDSDNDPLLCWFSPSTASAIRRWECAIRMIYPDNRFPDESGFMLTALFETARALATNCNSRNPTWVKEPARSQRARHSRKAVDAFLVSTAHKKALLCSQRRPFDAPDLRLGSSTSIPLADGAADFVLTSPPYCTRIDYAVTTRIELAVLGQQSDAMRSLRDCTMGTTTVRDEIAAMQSRWGRECINLLRAVRCHASKASSSYYLKTFLQYFGDLFESLSEIDRCVRPGGCVVIVVQDSCYKGLLIDLPRIVEQMARGFGWKRARVERFEVIRSMRRMNTRSRRYRTDVESCESVIWFRTRT